MYPCIMQTMLLAIVVVCVFAFVQVVKMLLITPKDPFRLFKAFVLSYAIGLYAVAYYDTIWSIPWFDSNNFSWLARPLNLILFLIIGLSDMLHYEVLRRRKRGQ